ncbi:hypothetical protein F4775DRAFT_578238 [Biscogniauxia sp. FL1348]|nr:hypothetical protein F4775DRAFT_578238 [Biscogniauxia sp. FL1348]
MTREAKHKKPRKERKPRWRTLSPNARAAKVAAREERKAAFDAAHPQTHKAAATAAGNSATEDQNSPANDNPLPRLTGNKKRQGRNGKTARVDGKAQAPVEDLPEASTTAAAAAAEDLAVASGEVDMPDAPDGEAKIPEEDSNIPNAPNTPNTPKKATPQKPKTEAEQPAAVENNHGGVRLLRSRTRAQ